MRDELSCSYRVFRFAQKRGVREKKICAFGATRWENLGVTNGVQGTRDIRILSA